MILSNSEFNRIFQFVEWGVTKKEISDPDFISAYQKLLKLSNVNNNEYSINEVKTNKSTYDSLSDKAKDYIDKRIEQGFKNTYHSLMAVLDNKSKHSKDWDKEAIKREYISKYHIQSDDYEAFDEIFETCFSTFEERMN